MGLFFEGVSVGDGEGDGIVAAGLGASETEKEADEGAAENQNVHGVLSTYPSNGKKSWRDLKVAH